jgi:hypothetical protein
LSDEEQVVLKLLEDLENDMEVQKENHFGTIVDDARFRKMLDICRKEKVRIYPALFRHLRNKKKFTTALLLDLAIGHEMVEVIKSAITTHESQVSYDIKKYIDAIIAYGEKMGYLPKERS